MTQNKQDVYLKFYYRTKTVGGEHVVFYYATLNLQNSNKAKIFSEVIVSDDENITVALAYYSVLSQIKKPVILHVTAADVVKLQALSRTLPELKIVSFPHDFKYETIKTPNKATLDKLAEIDNINSDNISNFRCELKDCGDYYEIVERGEECA